MSSVLAEIDHLRTRFNTCRVGRTFLALEKEILVSRIILSHFASGGRIGIESLVKLEAWCACQEGHAMEKESKAMPRKQPHTEGTLT
jgi:hypothetical protein